MVAFLYFNSDMELTLIAGSTLITLLTALYYLWEYNLVTLLIATIGATYITAKYQARNTKHIHAKPVYATQYHASELSSPILWITLIALAAMGLLLGTLIGARTGQVVISPWSQISSAIFILYALSLSLLLYLADKLPTGWWRALFHIQTFLTVSVVALIVKHGFGFDPFIHRASVDHILQNGSILPKQPYYVGQYVVQAALHHISGVRILFIDIWLVPILATILLPWIALRYTQKTHAALLLLFPLSIMTFTVPYNIAGLLLLIQCFLIQHPNNTLLIFAIACACLTLHPLVGIPALILSVGYALVQKYPHQDTLITYSLAITTALTLPAAFIARSFQQYGTEYIHNPFARAHEFFNLFRDPFPTPDVPVFWNVLYTYKLFSIIPFILLVLWSGYKLRKAVQTYLLLALAVGIFIAAFGIRSSITFPEIIWYEQSEFALRLIALIPLIMAPVILQALQTIPLKTYIIPLALIATVHWYFMYPQLNPKIQVGGWSVSDTDTVLIQKIHSQHQVSDPAKTPYIVLAHQITSVAALEVLGFKTTTPNGEFPYGYGSTSSLAQSYERIMYHHPDHQILMNAMKRAQVESAYLIIPHAWWNAEHTIQSLLPFATRSFRINDEATVLEYTHPSTIY